jgi:hypothetical protein
VARVLVISASDLGRDARVDRQIEFLSVEHDVIAAGFGEPRKGAGFIRLDQLPRMSPRWIWGRLAMEILRTLGADVRAYWTEPGHAGWRKALAGVEPDVVVANDMSAVPLAFDTAKGAPVVIDLHEYAPREHEEHLLWRLLVAPQLRRLLRRYLPLAAELVTVNEPIAEAYEQRYGRRPVVVTNAARKATCTPSELEPGRIRLVHHGAALRGRRIEQMIDLAKELDERFTLDLYLVGEEAYLSELSARMQDHPRIRLNAPLPMDSIVTELNRYDVGLYLLAPTNFNNLYALPNKFFDFVQARLAVAIGPSPAMADLASRYGFGLVADSFEPQVLLARLQALDATRVVELKQAADRAADELSAERNGEIMRALVRGALARPSRAEAAPLAPHPARP